jgi:Peptidase A4 family
MKTSISTLTLTKLAAAAGAAALAAGLSACSAAPAHGAGSSGGQHGTRPATTAQPNAGGTMTRVTPAERTRALTAFRTANPAGRAANVSLSHLLSSLPGDLPEVSGNWSGYQVLSAKTGVAARSASGTWVVPAVTVPSAGKPGFSSTWVGIGGSCLDAACRIPDHSLIQLGTSQNVSSTGQAQYYAWYETLPQTETPLPQLSIAPGDTVSAGLEALRQAPSGGQVWQLWMVVRSPSGAEQRWSKIVTYDSSLASAEWITEGPSADCGGHIGELPLADYHQVTFSNLLENGAAPDLALPNLIIAYDPYGQLSIPAPASLPLLHVHPGTYFLPFVPKGTAQTQGRAACQSTADAR